MRVAIDARELSGRPTGVGRYLSEILQAWAALPGALAHDFILCAPAADVPPGLDALRISVASARGRGTRWEQLTLPRLVRSARADVLFAPAYTGPVRSPVPMVVTIHDVSFAAHPEWFSWREGRRRRLVTRLSAQRAARVITVSDFSKREIVRHLGIDGSKVDVLYSGATKFAASTGQEPLVLYVGSLFNRRHVPELIEAFARLTRRHPQTRLEIVGDNRTLPHVDVDALIERSGAQTAIRARSYLSDAELTQIHERARAFAFISSYEGFGMTPLDALAAGIPPVVLDTEVAREIYGPAAVYVDSVDPAAIEAGLERALFDERERTRILEAAPLQLERYSWRECAQRTLQILLACAQGHR